MNLPKFYFFLTILIYPLSKCNEYDILMNYFIKYENFIDIKRSHYNKANEFKKNYIVISLGYSCRTALAINYFQLSEYSFPLNWLLVSFFGLYNIFKNDFKEFFNKENLLDHGTFEGKPYRNVLDSKYCITSIHDFLSPDYLQNYNNIKEKFERRIKRLYMALNSNKLIYFIRTEITKEESIQFNDLIKSKFPNLKYIFIVINDDLEFKEAWNIKNVKNFYFDDLKINWLNLEKWKKLFLELELINTDFNNSTTQQEILNKVNF